MRQTRLDESKQEDQASKKQNGPPEDETAAGSKRKEPASDAEEEPSSQDKGGSSKSRKTDATSSGSKDGAAAPTKLSGDQRKVDSKLKGDDVEVNKGDSDNDHREEGKSNSEVPWHVSEKGLVYFFYRPKVMSSDKAESNTTESLDDVGNTFMLLVPRASDSDTAPASDAVKAKQEQDDKRKPPNPTAYRLVSLGKKRMPSPEAALKSGQEPGGIGGRHSEAIWATVADIGADLKAAGEGLGEERYSTKTRGECFCSF